MQLWIDRLPEAGGVRERCLCASIQAVSGRRLIVAVLLLLLLLLLLSILRGGGPACTAACTLAGRNCSGNAILRDSTNSLAAISEEYGSAPFIRRGYGVCRWESWQRAGNTAPPRRAPD